MDGAKRHRQGEGSDDPLAFQLRQSALRAVEHHKLDALTLTDRVFCTWALHYADRDAAFVSVILSSQLRVDFTQPATLVATADAPTEVMAELTSYLKEMDDAAAASADATGRAREYFFAHLHKYVMALEAVRDADEAETAAGQTPAMRREIEDEALDLLERSGPSLHLVVAEFRAIARAAPPGVQEAFLLAAARMGDVIVARRRLDDYDTQFRVDEPPPAPFEAPVGRTPDALLSETDCAALMKATGEQLDENQQLFMDEVPAYAEMPAWAQRGDARKPDRFAKVMAGYRWTRYNKTHYNSATNPPPKTINAYEFTLMYPDLEGGRVPRYEVSATEKGFDEDEFCIITFRAGPPYLDVAYRIINKQWDKRAVKATFEPNGRFKLYFRLMSTSYRR